MTLEKGADAAAETKIPKNILIVEDDPGLARLMHMTLSRNGYQTLVVKSGAEAIETASSQTVDLMVLDYRLSDMTADQVVYTLAQSGRAIPFIIVTGFGDQKIAVAMMKLGAIDYLVKDMVFLEMLPHAVNQAIEKIESESKLFATREELELSEHNFRTSIEESPIAIIITKGYGEAEYANQAALDLFGYRDFEEMKNTPITENHSKENLEIIKDRWDRIANGVFTSEQHNHYVFGKDGEPHFVEAFYKEILCNGQKRIQVLMLDSTDRRKAEEALYNSNELLKTVFNNTDEAITVINAADYTIAKANDVFLRQCGARDESEVIGKTCYQMAHHRQEPCADRDGPCPLRDSVLNKKTSVAEHRYRTDDGKEVVIEVSTSLLRTDGGEVLQVVHSSRDITARWLVDQEQQRSARIESVGTLAGGLAHDFNNILTGILGNISLARMNLEDGEKSETSARLKDAEQASLRARDLTQQLLTFSRGGAPVKQTVNLASLLRETAEFALRGSAEKAVYDIDKDLWAVEADEGQINQVISNIIINADQSMPQGGVINISARNLQLKKDEILNLPGGNYVRISIEDHGLGMSAEILKRVFEPYFTTKQKGSGLGLATSYSIVRNHGGLISVESELSRGTTFHIYLPAQKKPAPKKVEEAVQPNLSGHGRILVMDDENTIRLLLRRQLGMIGYETEVAKDGEEAIERYRQALAAGRPFDAVIMDLTVPGGMGGKEAIVKLREIDPQVKAIVSSGYSNDPIMAHPEEYGFNGVTAKPFQVRDLDETLKRVIGL